MSTFLLLQSDIFYDIFMSKGEYNFMNFYDPKICERFKQIRKNLQINQKDFATEIKVSQGHVSDIENKRKNVSNRIIEIICLKYDINETWFRTGSGEMYKKRSSEDRYAINIGKLQRSNNETIINWINTIAETDPDTLKLIETFMKKILNIA